MNEFLLSMAFAVLGAAVLPVQGLIALTVAALVVGPIACSLARLFGGLNVQFAYALGQIAEIAALAAVAVHIALGSTNFNGPHWSRAGLMSAGV